MLKLSEFVNNDALSIAANNSFLLNFIANIWPLGNKLEVSGYTPSTNLVVKETLRYLNNIDWFSTYNSISSCESSIIFDNSSSDLLGMFIILESKLSSNSIFFLANLNESVAVISNLLP